MSKQCEFSGCTKSAVWECRKLWGKGGVILTCDDHKPGSVERPAALASLPSFYDVKPLGDHHSGARHDQAAG